MADDKEIKRIETLGIIRPKQTVKEVNGREINTISRGENNVIDFGDVREDTINTIGDRRDRNTREYLSLEQDTTSQNRSSTELHTRSETHKGNDGRRELSDGRLEKEIDYKEKARELNENRPSFEELKALEQLSGDLQFSQEVFIPLRSERGHEISEYGAKLYLETKEKYKDILPQKIDEIKYPINADNIARLERLRDYFKTIKDMGEDLGFKDVANPNQFKALLYDLNTYGKIQRATTKQNQEYKELYFNLQKLYDEFEPKIKELYKENTPKNIDEALKQNLSIDEIDKLGLMPFANGSGALSGAFAGSAEAVINQRDYNNNGVFDEEDMVIGAIIGAVGLKAATKMFPNWFKIDDVGIGANLTNKEKKNILQVAQAEKPSTIIRKYDDESLKDFIEFEKGGFNTRSQKGVGFDKIAIRHMQDGSSGYISVDELVKIGDVIRKGEFKLKENGLREYTLWQDDIRYKAIVGDNDKNERVVSYYSNRQGGGT